jgi:hypothetical protein
LKAPNEAEEGSQNEMCCIYKQDLTFSKSRFFKPRKHFTGVEIELELMVTLAGNWCSSSEFETKALHEASGLTLTQTDAYEFLDTLHGLLGVCDRVCVK